METQTELCCTKNQHSQTVNESDVQDLEPNMNKDQWTDVISRNWNPSLLKTTEIKDGNLFSSDDAVFKVLLTDRSGEVSGMDKVPELRDIKEDYGILYKEHSIRVNNEWLRVQSKWIKAKFIATQKKAYDLFEKIKDDINNINKLSEEKYLAVNCVFPPCRSI